MNTQTGEIKQFKKGDLIPKGFKAIDKLPKRNCHICGGKGSILVSKWRRFLGTKDMYKPCSCIKNVL